MAAYSPTFRRLSPAKRIPLYNTFVFPLFSYLASTYSIPALGSISKKSVRKVVSKVLISYGGRAFPYDNIIAPPSKMGLRIAIKDIWAYSLSLLASKLT